MSNLIVVVGKLTAILVALVCGVFLCLVPRASADSSYQTTAGTSIALPIQGTACSQTGGGVGQTAASAACSFLGSSASASGSMITGSASVSATDNGVDYPVSAGLSWIVGGTIGGTGSSGLITLSDSSIAVNASGKDPGASLFLSISDPTEFNQNSAQCVVETPAQVCGVKSSLSTSLFVNNGDQVYLSFSMNCGAAFSSACSMSDGLMLTLPSDLTLTTGVPDFLSGSTPTAEPSSVFLFGIGLFALSFFFWRGTVNSLCEVFFPGSIAKSNPSKHVAGCQQTVSFR